MSDAPMTEPPAAAAVVPRSSFGWAALGVVLVAGGLRLWGLDLGLPHLEARPDETETLRLTLDAAGGSFDFDWAIYPHAYVYLQWAWAEGVLLAQSWGGGGGPPPTTWSRSGAASPSGCMRSVAG